MSLIRFCAKIPGQKKESSTYAWEDVSGVFCIAGRMSESQGWNKGIAQIEISKPEMDYIVKCYISQYPNKFKKK